MTVMITQPEVLRVTLTAIRNARTSGTLRASPALRPELVGRNDEKIVFKPLSPDTQREIGRLTIAEELDRLRKQGFDLSISESAFEFMIRRGIHKTLGARPMKRTVQKIMADAIRQALKSGHPPTGTLAVTAMPEALNVPQSILKRVLRNKMATRDLEDTESKGETTHLFPDVPGGRAIISNEVHLIPREAL